MVTIPGLDPNTRSQGVEIPINTPEALAAEPVVAPEQGAVVEAPTAGGGLDAPQIAEVQGAIESSQMSPNVSVDASAPVASELPPSGAADAVGVAMSGKTPNGLGELEGSLPGGGVTETSTGAMPPPTVVTSGQTENSSDEFVTTEDYDVQPVSANVPPAESGDSIEDYSQYSAPELEAMMRAQNDQLKDFQTEKIELDRTQANPTRLAEINGQLPQLNHKLVAITTAFRRKNDSAQLVEEVAANPVEEPVAKLPAVESVVGSGELKALSNDDLKHAYELSIEKQGDRPGLVGIRRILRTKIENVHSLEEEINRINNPFVTELLGKSLLDNRVDIRRIVQEIGSMEKGNNPIESGGNE